MSLRFGSADTALGTLLAVSFTGRSTNYTVLVPASSVQDVAVDFDVTALGGVSPTAQILVERKDGNGNWRSLYNPAAQSAAGVQSTTLTNVLTRELRVTVTLGGTTPTADFNISLMGR